MMNRRHFLKSTGSSIVSLGIAMPGSIPAYAGSPLIKGVGICDWTLGGAADPQIIEKAASVGLECLQVSVGTNPDNIVLRDPAVRKTYKKLSKQYKVKVCSVAAGGILNQYPLATEPMSAVFVIDALEAAWALGADNILTAFFGKGDLRRKDENGRPIVETETPHTIYQLDEMKVDRVISALKQIAPRAEDLGVYIGLENTLTARQNMDIIHAVGSGMLKVYYDVGNSWGNGYDVPGEIQMLGNEMISEVHIKDKGTQRYESGEGMVDMKACAKALDNVGYHKWLVLETRGRKDHFEEDTRSNLRYVKKTFGLV
jgi:sugar phosphate isomerase/epimerase